MDRTPNLSPGHLLSRGWEVFQLRPGLCIVAWIIYSLFNSGGGGGGGGGGSGSDELDTAIIILIAVLVVAALVVRRIHLSTPWCAQIAPT